MKSKCDMNCAACTLPVEKCHGGSYKSPYATGVKALSRAGGYASIGKLPTTTGNRVLPKYGVNCE